MPHCPVVLAAPFFPSGERRVPEFHRIAADPTSLGRLCSGFEPSCRWGEITLTQNTFAKAYEITAQIPYGRVTTYGQIARLIGNPRLSRIVGCAMNAAPPGLPCHRVVNRFGGLCDAFLPLGRDTHRMLLELEGVPFRPDGTVDLDQVMWYGPEDR